MEDNLNFNKYPSFDSVFLRPIKFILKILGCVGNFAINFLEEKEKNAFTISLQNGEKIENLFDLIILSTKSNDSKSFESRLDAQSTNEKQICEIFNDFHFVLKANPKNSKDLNDILVKFENLLPQNIAALPNLNPFYILPYICIETLKSLLFSDDFLNNLPILKSLNNLINLNEKLQPILFGFDSIAEKDLSSESGTNEQIFGIISQNLDKFIDYAILNGADYYYITPDNRTFYVDHIPFSAFPMQVYYKIAFFLILMNDS
jgi:hypothetical protein